MTKEKAHVSAEGTVMEPYERFRSNKLRSECYRRKLQVVKTGPYTNTTKRGYIQLLRASDANPKSTQKMSIGVANSLKPIRQHLNQMVAKPQTCSRSDTSLLPSARIDEDHTLSSQPFSASNASCIHVVSPSTSVSDMSVSSVSARSSTVAERSMMLQFADEIDTKPSRLTENTKSSMIQNNDADLHVIENDSLYNEENPRNHRWERLHARLVVVDERLETLKRKLQTTSAMDKSELVNDLHFYHRVKLQLKEKLLYCADQ